MNNTITGQKKDKKRPNNYNSGRRAPSDHSLEFNYGGGVFVCQKCGRIRREK